MRTGSVALILLGFLTAGCDTIAHFFTKSRAWKNGTYIATLKFDRSLIKPGYEHKGCGAAIDLHGIELWTKKMTCASAGKTEGIIDVSCAADDGFSITPTVYRDSYADSSVDVWVGPGPSWYGTFDEDHPAWKVACGTNLRLSAVTAP